MTKVVITDCDLGPTDLEESLLTKAGFALEVADVRTARDVALIGKDADALIVQWAEVDAEAIAQLARCRIISRYGIGVDNIDIAAATDAGIAVANVDDYCLEEVATHTVGLIYALARQLRSGDAAVRGGAWSSSISPRKLSDATVGFVGFGRIAQLVSRHLSGSGAELIAYDPVAGHDADGVVLVDFDELIERADVLTLHCPLTDKTRHLIDGSVLQRMKKSALLVNTARGALIDESALVDALDSGWIGGAGLDVFEEEPLPAASPLRSLDNVILTPHIAWKSESSLPSLRRGAVENVISFFDGEPMRVINDYQLEPGR